jgi:hypothetical protein
MKQILIHIMIIISSILLISACDGIDKEVRGLKEDNQVGSENKEILFLISDLRETEVKLRSLSTKTYNYMIEKLEDDPRLEKLKDDPRIAEIEIERESLLKKAEGIIDQLIKIGHPVIPYAREMLKNKDKESLIREDAIYILGEVSRNRGDKEVILDLLAILPSEEHHTRLNVRSALLKIGKPAIPYLINELEDKDVKKRFLLFELLQRMTGQKFEYYNFEGTDSKGRQKAVEKIKDWWEKNKDSWEMPAND